MDTCLYSDALKNSIKQQAIMDIIMQIEGLENTWQDEMIEKKILALIGDA
jgi:hypothetical protein